MNPAPPQTAEEKSSLVRKVWRWIRPLLIAYLVVLLVLIWLESAIVYPAPTLAEGEWSSAQGRCEEVEFASLDGVKLHGFYFAHAQPKRSILYCHGNGEDISHNVDLMEFLRDRYAANVLIFDYRGYGRSAGKPNEAGLVNDGRSASRFLAERAGCKTSDLVLWGRSLGGGVAVAIAAEEGAKALVLESTFSRMVDVGAARFPWLPVRLVMRNRYDSIARIAKFAGLVFQSHGDADEVVPFHFAQTLHAAIPSANKKFFTVRGGFHNSPQPERYYEEVAAFLAGF